MFGVFFKDFVYLFQRQGGGRGGAGGEEEQTERAKQSSSLLWSPMWDSVSGPLRS